MTKYIRTARVAAATSALLAASITFAQAPAGRGPGGPATPPPPPTAGAKLDVMEGSSATYRVTEQLAGVSFPNDAVGTTDKVTGAITIAADGTIAPGSKLVISLKELKSDQEMRDGYVRGRTLETDKFPDAVFVPTKIDGLPRMIPATGQVGVSLSGDLTIHGVTKPVIFQGIATMNPRDSTVAGRAQANLSFSAFGITRPTLTRLVSVDDKIVLELVYKFKRS